MKSISGFHGSNHINFNAADMGVIPNTPIRWNSFLELLTYMGIIIALMELFSKETSLSSSFSEENVPEKFGQQFR